MIWGSSNGWNGSISCKDSLVGTTGLTEDFGTILGYSFSPSQRIWVFAHSEVLHFIC